MSASETAAKVDEMSISGKLNCKNLTNLQTELLFLFCFFFLV